MLRKLPFLFYDNKKIASSKLERGVEVSGAVSMGVHVAISFPLRLPGTCRLSIHRPSSLPFRMLVL